MTTVLKICPQCSATFWVCNCDWARRLCEECELRREEAGEGYTLEVEEEAHNGNPLNHPALAA